MTRRRQPSEILNSPTAVRIMRPGWENAQFIPDPTNPNVAIAILPDCGRTSPVAVSQ